MLGTFHAGVGTGSRGTARRARTSHHQEPDDTFHGCTSQPEHWAACFAHATDLYSRIMFGQKSASHLGTHMANATVNSAYSPNLSAQSVALHCTELDACNPLAQV